ncbi:MAG: DNA invertase Pin-like site-specific DNA recombinase [Ilumatobacter sp.]|jgi:site-specific DNA recombinase
MTILERTHRPDPTVAAPRAVVYCRISADLTGEAAGVDRQEAMCRELADREGYEVVEVLADNDVSAYSGVVRPGYERLLHLIETGSVDAVVAYHVDRLYRRILDLGRLAAIIEQHRVDVRTVSAGDVELSTASGRFTAQILAAAAEHESARIGERVSAKHKHNAAQGRAHGGGRAYGYRRLGPGKLEVVPDEAAVIRWAAEQILRGASLNSLVIDLNDREVPTVRGGKWRPNSLSKVLRAGRIAGLREVGGEAIGEGDWEPILERVTWERVAARITHAPVGRRPRRNLLAGFVFCDQCGSKMKARSEGKTKTEGPKNYRNRQYACDKAGGHGCGSNSVNAERVEEIAVGLALGAIANTDLRAATSLRVGSASAELIANLAADKQMLDVLAGDFGSRRIGRAEWIAASDPIRQRIADAEAELGRADVVENIPSGDVDAERWQALEFDEQRAIVGAVFDRIVIRKGAPGRGFDPARVSVSWRSTD